MPESTPALWPVVLLMSAAAGFVLLGVWAASPHRRPDWTRRRGKPRGARRGRRDSGRTLPGPPRRDRFGGRDLTGAGRTYTDRNPPRPVPHGLHGPPDFPPDVPPHPAVDPARRPLR